MTGDVVDRIWARDATVWRDDPHEIADRLGWLTVADEFRDRTPELLTIAQQAAADGFERAVLLGMGGSSLAAETMRRTFGKVPGGLDLTVLDSTHPDTIARVEHAGDLRRTLFIVSSKSGTTIETLCHLQYFYGRIQRGDHFVVITDPGSSLASLAEGHGFRGAFLNPPDIGGRYSALSLFGLVPAALMGADVEALLDAATDMARRCRETGPSNPGAALGVFLGEAARAGKNKATFLLPDNLASLGLWVEQLIAESTGKEGRGIVPVIGDGPDARVGGDRAYVDYTAAAALSGDVFDVSPEHLGAEFFRLEFATAVAGHILDINPFDQPNVAEAKEATNAILASGHFDDPGFDDPRGVLEPPPDYLGILAFVDPSPANEKLLEQVRASLRDRLGIAVTAGFGPRYLHSTGQLHKGGPDGGAFLMVVDGMRTDDIAVPGREFTFGTLLDAQALGDLRSLRARERRVARIRLQDLHALV